MNGKPTLDSPKDRFWAAIIWSFLLLQTVVILGVTEPFPSFSFPGFGQNFRNAETVQPTIEYVRILAVNNKDTVDLSNNTYFRNLVNIRHKVFCKSLLKRSEKKLKRSDYDWSSWLVYRRYFEASYKNKIELKTWIQTMYGFIPKAVLLQIYWAPISSSPKKDHLHFVIKKTVPLEVFK